MLNLRNPVCLAIAHGISPKKYFLKSSECFSLSFKNGSERVSNFFFFCLMVQNKILSVFLFCEMVRNRIPKIFIFRGWSEQNYEVPSVFLFNEMVSNRIPSFYIFREMGRNGVPSIFRSAKRTEFCVPGNNFLLVK